MKTTVIARNPLHPMFIALPLGLWIFSFICDLIYLVKLGEGTQWLSVAFFTMLTGWIIAASGMFFLEDRFRNESPSKKITALHFIVMSLYFVNMIWRLSLDAGVAPWIFSGLGILLFSIRGWMGLDVVSLNQVPIELFQETNISYEKIKAA
jgi:uncharacterized membrane protein